MMSNFVIAIFSGLISFSALDEEGIEVQAIGGETVVLSTAEVERAHQVVLEKKIRSKNFGQTFVNDDGSVTLVRPFFMLDGHRYSFRGKNSQSVCKFFGFVTSVRHAVQGTEGWIVELNEQGKLQKAYHADSIDLLIYLTCR